MIHTTFTDDSTRPSNRHSVPIGCTDPGATDPDPKRVTLELDFSDPDALAGFFAEVAALLRTRRRVRVTVE
jgi:hypothetical protein